MTDKSENVFDNMVTGREEKLEFDIDVFDKDKYRIGKTYADAYKSAVITLLLKNKLNYRKTSQQTRLDIGTIKEWMNLEKENGFNIREELESTAYYLLSELPEFKSGRDWATALGIVLDKLIILYGLKGKTENNITNNMFAILGLDGTNLENILDKHKKELNDRIIDADEWTVDSKEHFKTKSE